MRTITYYLIIYLIALNSNYISGQANRCPIVIGPQGAQFITSFESAKKICNNRVKYITIEKVLKTPAFSKDYYSNIYASIKSDSMILVAKASDKYFTPPDGGMQFIMFKGVGTNSYWLGLDEYKGKYYTLINDTTLKVIGFQEQKYRDVADGNKILMTKGIGANEFYVGSSNGKIYKAKGDASVEQIGIFSSFWILPQDGTKFTRAIVMTKGLATSDKWTGELDGVIYIEK